MTKLTVLLAGLLVMAACQNSGNMNSFPTNESPVDAIAEPTDGIATDNN